MRKIGMMLAALALIAMTPSYGKKADAAERSTKVDESSSFNGLKTCIKFVDNTKPAGGNGTFLHPYNDIATAVNSSNDKCVIYVKATGTPYTLASTVTLKKEQSLIGSCIGLKLEGREISALTKSIPVVVVNTGANPGIEVGTSNRIVGFSFQGAIGTETAIGSVTAGVAHSCAIDKNLFTNLTIAVDLTVPGKAQLEFDGNLFSSVEAGLLLFTSEGVDVRACNNQFKTLVDGIVGAAFSVDKEFIAGIRSSDRAAAMRGCPCGPKAELLTGSAFGKPASRVKQASSSGNYFIEKNTFVDISGFAIFSGSANKLEFVQNKFSNIAAGLFIVNTQENIILDNSFDTINAPTFIDGVQKITAKRNTFSAAWLEVLLNENGTAHFGKNTFSNPHGPGVSLQLEQGAIAHVEGNAFSNSITGLGVSLQNGAIASVEKNKFSGNDVGVLVVGNDASTTPNCLQLRDNCAEDSTIGFEIVNGVDPSLFQLNLCNNKGSLVFIDNDVTLVEQCPRCAKGK